MTDASPRPQTDGPLRQVAGAVHEAVTLPIYRFLQTLILDRVQRIAARMHHA